MATTQNTYTGNGSTVLYSFTFPYLATTDIKVSVNGTNTTAYTLANATTVQFTAAPANGAAIRIFRVTDDATLAATFYPGSSIRSQDLNENFTQNLYVTQESNRDATTATSTAEGAVTTANTALSTANSATATANTAASNATAAVSTSATAAADASAAVSTANTASSNASATVSAANAAAVDAATAISTANGAVSTANAATSTANAASATATTASTNVSAAVSTANTASTNASNAVTTANTANTAAGTAVTTANNAVTTANNAVTTANTAVTTANAAASAVANAILFDTVANVAAIPATPANNDAVEVIDSTGIQGFTPLTGVPAGFVGSSGLSVRIVYTTIGNTWNWIQYFPNDPETRYLKFSGGTLTGQLRGDDSTSASTPGFAFDGDPDTGIGRPGSNELALVTGGVTRISIDSTGVAAFQAPFTAPGGVFEAGVLLENVAGTAGVLLGAPALLASSYQFTLPGNAGSVGQALTTDGTGSLGWASLAPINSPTFTGSVTIPAGAAIDGYLTTTDAASTYLTTADAASTYQTQAGMSTYLTTASASSTYQAKSGLDKAYSSVGLSYFMSSFY